MSVHIAVHQLVTNSDDRRVVVAHQLWLYRPRDPGGGHCWAGLASPQTPPVSTEAAPSCPSRAHRHPRTHPQGTHPWPSNTPSRNTTMAIKRKKLTKIAQRVKLYQKPSQTTSTSALRAVRMVTRSLTPNITKRGRHVHFVLVKGTETQFNTWWSVNIIEENIYCWLLEICEEKWILPFFSVRRKVKVDCEDQKKPQNRKPLLRRPLITFHHQPRHLL